MNDLKVIEYRGVRVLTTQQLAESYGTDGKIISNNFNRNKDRYIEGKHFICLESEDKRKFLNNHQIDDGSKNAGKIYLWTEKGALLHAKSLNTDTAWEVYDRLVESYFRVRQIVDDRLSPGTKMLYQMIDQIATAELQAKEAKEIAQEAKCLAQKNIETTESIKEAVQPVLDNWREETNAKFNRIQKNCGEEFNTLRTDMYKQLEQRAGCDLNARLRNKRNRMAESGCKKTEINKLNKMDIIEEDKKLREIFSKIVSEYEIKYCT